HCDLYLPRGQPILEVPPRRLSQAAGLRQELSALQILLTLVTRQNEIWRQSVELSVFPLPLLERVKGKSLCKLQSLLARFSPIEGEKVLNLPRGLRDWRDASSL